MSNICRGVILVVEARVTMELFLEASRAYCGTRLIFMALTTRPFWGLNHGTLFDTYKTTRHIYCHFTNCNIGPGLIFATSCSGGVGIA